MFSQIANRLVHGVIASEGADTIATSLGGDTAVVAVTQSGVDHSNRYPLMGNSFQLPRQVNGQ